MSFLGPLVIYINNQLEYSMLYIIEIGGSNMNSFRLIMIHTVNLLYLVPLGFITFGSLVNPSADGINFFNPLMFGAITFLYLYWFVNYFFQIKNKDNLRKVLIGMCLFPVVSVLIFPFLFNILYQFLYN